MNPPRKREIRSAFAFAVARRLKSLRRDRGLTGERVARELDISLKSYWNYESGVRELPTAIAVRFCQRYDADLTWLVTGNRENRPHQIADRLEVVLTEMIKRCQYRGIALTPRVASRIGRALFENGDDGGQKLTEQVDRYLDKVEACPDASCLRC